MYYWRSVIPLALVLSITQAQRVCLYSYVKQPLNDTLCNPFPPGPGVVRTTCKVQAANEELGFSLQWVWRQNGIPSSTTLSASAKYGISNSQDGNTRTSVLEIRDITSSDAGEFWCSILPADGSAPVPPINILGLLIDPIYRSLSYPSCPANAMFVDTTSSPCGLFGSAATDPPIMEPPTDGGGGEDLSSNEVTIYSVVGVVGGIIVIVVGLVLLLCCLHYCCDVCSSQAEGKEKKEEKEKKGSENIYSTVKPRQTKV